MPPPLTPDGAARTRLRLRHRTAYRYDQPVALGPQTIRLRPAPHARAPILHYALSIVPQEHSLRWHQDPAGNFLARVLFPAPVTSLEIEVELELEIGPANAFDFIVDAEAATWPFRYPELLEPELVPFRTGDPGGTRLAELLAESPGAETPGAEHTTVQVLTQLARLVKERIAYEVRLEAGVQSPEQTLARRSGSCRDSAWLLVQMLRRHGFAARFVSGYLIQLAEPAVGSGADTPDRADLHAWAEAYLPGAGWIGLDSTSGLLTGEAHVPLAASASPASAAPISGTVEQRAPAFEVAMSVARVAEHGGDEDRAGPGGRAPAQADATDRGH
ncbi:MAG: transglutaminase family protein [Dongiaceae bacterium]